MTNQQKTFKKLEVGEYVRIDHDRVVKIVQIGHRTRKGVRVTQVWFEDRGMIEYKLFDSNKKLEFNDRAYYNNFWDWIPT